ncbi:MAG: DMT family transporter [Gammaproteobacteria bacterium]|nr:DMT family transporter [Gammaproteobacteria bacterium]
MTRQTRGLLLGFVAVTGFSLTPPATRAAVLYLDPLFVSCGRAVLAGILATLLLGITKQSLPPRDTLISLLVVACCLVILFPLLLSFALQAVSAAHAGVMLGVLPLVTALVVTLRCKAHLPWLFWCVSAVGAATVSAFSLWRGQGVIETEDWLLVIAVVVAAIGYAEGARLSERLGGWQTICWALVFGAPVLVVPLIIRVYESGIDAPASAWYGFFYVALVSQLFAFFPWYHGMAIAGAAKVSQLMLLLPLMTMVFSSWLLQESVDAVTWLFAAAIVLIVAFGWWLPVKGSTYTHND